MKDWNELTMKERAAFIKTGVANGLRSIDDIQKGYKEYAEGGDLNIESSFENVESKAERFLTNSLEENYSFAQGGPLSNTLLKPFSYESVPEVRFATGGLEETVGISNNSAMDDYWERKRKMDALTVEAIIGGKKKILSRNDATDYGTSYYDVIESRYNGLNRALLNRGYSKEEADRLARLLTKQQIVEGGYYLKNKFNNFAGMLDNEGNKIAFPTMGDYYNAYLDMLDKKWPTWNTAQTVQDYADIVNHEQLKLKTKEAWKQYNKEHPGEEIQLYAPEWENTYDDGTPKPYSAFLNNVQGRVDGYLQLMDLRNSVK